ncbi:MAG: SET domain-containing protein-lysine N-methyltransferase, partial [Chlamydiia bacterium]|nr:SET domain-containing protein-lysine N-methyltransferase [Chlamydiia bacterium]
GDFIGAYTGLVHTLTEQEQNPYCFHYPTTFFFSQVLAIDAAKEGNLLRFLNHSNTPNLQPAWGMDRNLLHLTFFTNRPIEKGEQLTFNYGPHFWRHRDVIHS